jgi:ATP-dependent helicase HrpB
MKPSATPLPVFSRKEEILSVLERTGVCILSAPTGTGKSTQVPRFLRSRPGRTLVLEPRRIAARALAVRVAEEEGVQIGGPVGYQVRFDNRVSSATTVCFQTYGIFLQALLSAPTLEGVGTVVFDEFHERSAECDLGLAWCRALRRSGLRPDLRIVVMSATLETEFLSDYFPEAGIVSVEQKAYPVAVGYAPPFERERPGQTVLRALLALAREGLEGTTLVFMPGRGEIARTVNDLAGFCRAEGFALKELHGSLSLSEQADILSSGATGRRIVVCTNVAETSLTVPSVTAVIDSGWHRVAVWDAERDINTLRLERISAGNRDQRTGRAGRTAPGRCLRLWSETEDKSLRPSVPPEILRTEPGRLRLETEILLSALDRNDKDRTVFAWLTQPDEQAWERSGRMLREIGGLDADGRVTAAGRRLAEWPLGPRLAAVLDSASALDRTQREKICAMAALLESEPSAAKEGSLDLGKEAERFLAESGDAWSRDVRSSFEQLKRMSGQSAGPARVDASLEKIWMGCYPDRLAGRDRDASVYVLQDGRKALLVHNAAGKEKLPSCVLVLSIHETGGAGQNRKITIPSYLPIDPAVVAEFFRSECGWRISSDWDKKREKTVSEEALVFRGVVLDRRPVRTDKSGSAELWAEKIIKGEISLEGSDDEAEQAMVRIRLAKRLWPDYGFPGLDNDDLLLVYSEMCRGKNSLQEIKKIPVAPQFYRYIGPELSAFLDRMLPVSFRLPSGRKAKIRYFEDRPAELSARITDFIGWKPGWKLGEGRVPFVFDILAPNWRTVQKTADIDSFWKKDYPEMKKSLQRRYPRHPWP